MTEGARRHLQPAAETQEWPPARRATDRHIAWLALGVALLGWGMVIFAVILPLAAHFTPFWTGGMWVLALAITASASFISWHASQLIRLAVQRRRGVRRA